MNVKWYGTHHCRGNQIVVKLQLAKHNKLHDLSRKIHNRERRAKKPCRYVDAGSLRRRRDERPPRQKCHDALDVQQKNTTQENCRADKKKFEVWIHLVPVQRQTQDTTRQRDVMAK